MSNNCLTCKLRIKADATWDEEQGDFWHCTAVVPVHSFGVMWLENRHKNPTKPHDVSRLINIAMFKKEHQHFKLGLMERDCPLWESQNNG